MKCLGLILLLAVCVSGAFHDALDRASDDVVEAFLAGMEKAPPLRTVLGGGYSEEAEQIEADIKTELGKSLKESLDNILQKIRQTVDQGKEIGQELVNKAKDIAQKLKELGLDAGSKAKELIERLKEKAQDWLKNLLEKLGLGKIGKRDLGGFLGEMLLELEVKALLRRMKDKLLDKFDVEVVAQYIERVFGHFSEIGKKLIESFKTRGVSALKELLETLLPDREVEIEETSGNYVAHVRIAIAACKIIKMITSNVPKAVIKSWVKNNVEPNWRDRIITAIDISFPVAQRLLRPFCFAAAEPETASELEPVTDYALQDIWEKVKNLFKDLGLQIQQKFIKFGDWVRQVVQQGLINAQEKILKIKELALQVIIQANDLKAEVLQEALEFFRPYKDDLVELWDQLVQASKNVIQ